VDEDADQELVQGCREGDRKACERLVLRYQKPVYNAALRLLHNPEDARDVAQTAFMKAFEHLAQYDPRFRFYSWIYRIAVNEALDTLGSRKPHEALSDEAPDEAAGPEQLVEGEQSQRAIEEALTRIKPELRAVIVLRHFTHLSYHEMAEILQLPEKTVKSRLHDARLLLREALLDRGTFARG
jgi:RNA polymerase sigma-70 factor (ECF subfamily)